MDKFAYMDRDVNLNSQPVISWIRCLTTSMVYRAIWLVSDNLCSSSQVWTLGTRLACFLSSSGSCMSGGPMYIQTTELAVSAWCSRSVHIVHVMADQKHRDCLTPGCPGYWYRTELVWRIVIACANCWIVPLRIQRPFKRMLAVAIYPQ